MPDSEVDVLYGIGGAPAADVARAVAEVERAAQAVADAMEAARP